MNKENEPIVKLEEPTGRITRARAKAQAGAASKPSFKQDKKCVLRVNSKRASSDENKASMTSTVGLKTKRRAVLKDVTNVSAESADSMHVECLNANKIQTSKQTIRDPRENDKQMVEDIFMGVPSAEEDVNATLAEGLSKIRMMEAQENTLSVKLEEREVMEFTCHTAEEDGVCNKLGGLKDVVDIDSNRKDPLVCSLYAPDIYDNKRVTELTQRPSTNYMEQLQRDITPSMRGILIDWLVEVSEEYKLVPDTLYLTVNLIDRFLSHNFIEKQRLQLLGVTCMLIASKYEEICAPRVEEFCFITDNTYTRGEVPCIELEFLANYLAELSLVEYSFLKFLPSLVAASAVFLARWTLNQSVHPWNPTLEHYTSYKASQLKATVLALEDLQLNTNGCTLSAIRDKYRQQKFKCVATMSSPERVASVFSRR
ncbi:hypothetical protein V6N13_095332 [Hibiscus sabdariffa]